MHGPVVACDERRSVAHVSETRWIGFSSAACEVGVTVLPVVGGCRQQRSLEGASVLAFLMVILVLFIQW